MTFLTGLIAIKSVQSSVWNSEWNIRILLFGVLRVLGCLVLLSAQLVLATVYLSMLSCIWHQFRALNLTAMTMPKQSISTLSRDLEVMDRWPRLHDALTDAVNAISFCYSLPVSSK